MKKLALTFFLILMAAPAWANNYFLAPASAGGNDSNNGTSASTPWLTPNHSVNCGDVITAASGTYSASSFNVGNWGTVNCPAGNNVAWVQCAAFDTCKINASGTQAMKVTANYWGVQGFEATASGSFAGCFVVRPSGSATVHHIIFANNVANGCVDGGFSAFNNGGASVDYIVYIANIAYNAAQASDSCSSGFNIYEPVKSDSAPGTHLFVAGNFGWANVDPSSCAGGAPTDGEGLILDTFDGSQTGMAAAYDQQTVATNNIFVGNGGRGIEVFNNSSGSSNAPIFIYNNTLWGNETDTHQNSGGICAELELSVAKKVQVYNNVAQATQSTGCGGFNLYAYGVAFVDGTSALYNNVGNALGGHFSYLQNQSSFVNGIGNLFGTNPNFANPGVPGAPNCSSASNVPGCMSAMIANFTPTNPLAKPMGYQAPSTTPNSDPLFPQWLCNVNLPPGLITTPCASTSSTNRPAPVTITNVTVK